MFNSIPFLTPSPPPGVSLTGLFGRIGLADGRDLFGSAMAAVEAVSDPNLRLLAANIKIPYSIHIIPQLRKHPRKEVRMSPKNKERAAGAAAAQAPINGQMVLLPHTTTNPPTLQGFQNIFSKISPKFTGRLITN